MKFEVYASDTLLSENRDEIINLYNHEIDDMYNRYYYDDNENYDEIESWNLIGTYNDNIEEFID